AGAGDVRAATGGCVKALDLDDAQPFGVKLAGDAPHAHAARVFGDYQTRRDRTILGDDPVHKVLDLVEHARRDVGTVKVDGDGVLAEMEGDGVGVGHLHEGLRENVLPGVLLHEVEAAPGIYPALDLVLTGRIACQHVQHLAVLPRLHVHHLNAADDSGVVGLSAACGVEIGAGERNGGPVAGARALDDSRAELSRAGVVVVESLGHGASPGCCVLLSALLSRCSLRCQLHWRSAVKCSAGMEESPKRDRRGMKSLKGIAKLSRKVPAGLRGGECRLLAQEFIPGLRLRKRSREVYSRLWFVFSLSVDYAPATRPRGRMGILPHSGASPPRRRAGTLRRAPPSTLQGGRHTG